MINGVGLQRSGYSNEDIAALKDAFLKLFSRRARMSGVAMSERVQTVLDARPLNPHVQHLCQCLIRSFAHGRHGRYLESLRADRVHRSSWKLQNQYTLTVNVVGRGSVRQTANRASDHAHEVFELVAQAEPGWAFSGWDGGVTGRTNPASVVLDRNKTVDATFRQQS